MKKYKQYFILLLIILITCQFTLGKDVLNTDTVKEVYNITQNNFPGDFDRKEAFSNIFEHIKDFIEKQGGKWQDRDDIKITDNEEKDLQNMIAEIEHISSIYTSEKIKKEDILKEAIKGLLTTIDDPYSIYMTREEYKKLKESLDTPDFSGIGIYLELDKKNKNKLTVIEPIEGSPAFKSGIKSGDIIVRINGKSTEGINLDEAVNQIRGTKGTPVTITIERHGKISDFSITRDIIQVKSVTGELINKSIGYIKLRTFGKNTAEDFRKEIKELKNKGAETYIVDLRNNGGGYVDCAVNISETFLTKGSQVITVHSKNSPPVVYETMEEGTVNSKIVILINEYSASASEILAGAMKDNNRSVLIGEKSFGKGCIQTIYDLGSSGVLKLTTAYYYTPSGKKVDREGLEPDIKIMTSKDGKKDLQLEKAIDYLTHT